MKTSHWSHTSAFLRRKAEIIKPAILDLIISHGKDMVMGFAVRDSARDKGKVCSDKFRGS